jgi:hypothetical protein
MFPPVTSFTFLNIKASKMEDPGRPYVNILSLRFIEVQNKARTTGDASAIFPSIPLRINSHTAGILLLGDIDGILRSEELRFEFSKITFAVFDRGICQCANSSVPDGCPPVLSTEFEHKAIDMGRWKIGQHSDPFPFCPWSHTVVSPRNYF